MDIFFLTNAFNIGGLEQLTLETMRRLSGDEFRFHLCCLKKEGNLAPEVRSLGIPVEAGFLRHKYDLPGVMRLAKTLRDKKIDILFLEPGRNALLASEALRPLVPIGRRISALHATAKLSGEKLFRPGVLPLLKRLDGVVTLTRTQRDHLVSHEGLDPSNITVITNGVDHEKFRPVPREDLPLHPAGPKEKEIGVGIVASLNPIKGHGVFVEAAAIVAAEIPEARFFILGEGPERAKIEDHVERAGLSGVVRLLGNRRDLPSFLPHLRLLSLSSYSETLPISIMEGMACGLPVVTTDVGSLRELIVDGETGLIVPPDRPEAMASAFIRILRDPERAARMGRAGRKRIEEHFTLDRTVRDYADYFRRIAGGAA